MKKVNKLYEKTNKYYLIYNYYIIIIIIIIILGIFLYLNKNTIFEKFIINNKIEIVISRYNETLEWLNEEPFNKYPVIVYNKGINDDFNKSTIIQKVIQLNNVGRESHTYLYHIINNYDNLADTIVFLPGSTSIKYKKEKAINIINNISEENNNNIFPCSREDSYESQKDFSINIYLSQTNENKNINTDDKVLQSEIRPFGNWYKSIFDNQKNDCITNHGVFAVSKNTILNRPKIFYENLLNQLDKHHNPEVGHYIERSWSAIFYSNDNNIYV